jgi:hypothetical protein
MITEPSDIAANYLRTFFIVDFVAILPLPLEELEVGDFNPLLWGLLRVLRVSHFGSTFTEIHEFLGNRGFNVAMPTYRMVWILFFLFLLLPMLGSIYFYSACPNLYEGTACANNTWVENDNVLQEELALVNATDANPMILDTVVAKFTRSFYFMFQTLLTIGYGDSVSAVSFLLLFFLSLFSHMRLTRRGEQNLDSEHAHRMLI